MVSVTLPSAYRRTQNDSSPLAGCPASVPYAKPRASGSSIS